MYLVLLLVTFSRVVAEFRRNFSFIVISATWSVNFQMALLFYISLISLRLSIDYSSTKRGACNFHRYLLKCRDKLSLSSCSAVA